MPLGDLTTTTSPACPLPDDNSGSGWFFISDLDVVCPHHRNPGQKEPDPQFLILGGGASEAPYSIQSLGSQAHPCPSQVGGPPQVVTSKLDHSVGGPITQRRRGSQGRSVGIGDVEIGLNRLVTLVENISEPGQQIRWHSIVGVEHHQRIPGQ